MANQRIWKSANEVAVFLKPHSKKARESVNKLIDGNGEVLDRSNDYVIYVRIHKGKTASDLNTLERGIERLPFVETISPVFYGSESDDDSQSALTGQLIVRFRSKQTREQIDSFSRKYGLRFIKSFNFSSATYLFAANTPMDSLETANRVEFSGKVAYASPNWYHTRVTKSTPNDPLFSNQWHWLNTSQLGGTTGEDANITSAWDNFKGSANEVIAIVDDGLETGHEDLTENLLSSDLVNGLNMDWVGNDHNPNPGYGDDHGTCVAGVAAARGFNGLGVTGAAPEARLVGHRLLGANSDANEAEAMTANKDVIDISNNSWGPDDDKRLEGPGPLVEGALEYGAENGRNGKGIIYVWAGGNGAENGDNSNYDGYANSRYTIAVAASDASGKKAYYSEKGANVMLNAPSSTDGTLPSITTTDRSGADGYSLGNYTNDFGGTSSSTPVVSGVVAMMLQANPGLSYRDVQEILMSTASKNDPSDPDWTTNGAGYHVNHNYGFGRVDAAAAVEAAQGWIPLGSETTSYSTSSPEIEIPDDDTTGISDSITVSSSIRVDYVDVFFTAADHPYPGDLEVTLTSPQGTTSILSDWNPYTLKGTYKYDNWRFGSARHLGERSSGVWKLTVKDFSPWNTGTFQSWGLKIYGTLGPVTALTTDPQNPDGENGWFRTIPTVALSSSDSSEIYHQWDSILTVGWHPYFSPLKALEGLHTLNYYSVDGHGSQETSKNCQFKVDIVKPTNPTVTSVSHRLGILSGDRTIDVRLSGAYDASSGVSGYSIKWDKTALSNPDSTIDLLGNVSATTSYQLTDGNWYFHLKTKDAAGNWSSAMHFGPFRIDATRPALTLSSPVNNSYLRRKLVLRPIALDSAGISNVKYYLDGVLRGRDISYPYSFELNTGYFSNGRHILRFTVWDKTGNSTTLSRAVFFDNAIPSVRMITKNLDLSSLSRYWPVRLFAIDALRTRVRVTARVLKDGREVRLLVRDRDLIATGGRGTAATLWWNGRDSAGRRVSLGTYYLEIKLTDQAGNASVVKPKIYVVK